MKKKHHRISGKRMLVWGIVMVLLLFSACSAEKKTGGQEDPQLSKEVFLQQVQEAIRESAEEQEGDLDALFADYNGDPVQVTAGVNSSAAVNDAVCFYRSEAGESIEEIVSILFDAMIEPLTEESGDRSFTITAYEIPEQDIYTAEEVEAAILSHAEGLWDAGMQDSFSDTDAFVQYCINSAGDAGWFPIAEGMYEITGFHGYYAFEGIDLVTMEEACDGGSEMKEGMIPFISQGSEGSVTYILAQNGQTYRLQRAAVMIAAE